MGSGRWVCGETNSKKFRTRVTIANQSLKAPQMIACVNGKTIQITKIECIYNFSGTLLLHNSRQRYTIL